MHTPKRRESQGALTIPPPTTEASDTEGRLQYRLIILWPVPVGSLSNLQH